MSDTKAAVVAEDKVSPRLIELALKNAHLHGFWRCGDRVYQTEDSAVPLMNMCEFLYYDILSSERDEELPRLLFETRGTDMRAAAELTLRADDVRFPIRPA